MTPRLDEWIATLADPEDLARGQEVDPVAGAGYAALQRQLSEANAQGCCFGYRSGVWCGR